MLFCIYNQLIKKNNACSKEFVRDFANEDNNSNIIVVFMINDPYYILNEF